MHFFSIFEEFHKHSICEFHIWSSSQILETLGRFAGRATKSRRGSLISWTLRIRDFLVFFLMLPSFKIFCFCFFNVNYWQNVWFMVPLMTVLIYVKLRPNVDKVCFRRTKGFLWLWGRILEKFNWILVFCLQLLFFWHSFSFLSLTTQRSKFLPQKVQESFFYSFGCYLMSLMLLKVVVLRNFLRLFEIVNFL